ncbi:MAG TPA: hypothetical protein VI752_00075 [Candidatus Paceibacterota bacterium]|jgi:hypothetical protein|nr:hypothetical protein [Patescibacteria group bacterium]
MDDETTIPTPVDGEESTDEMMIPDTTEEDTEEAEEATPGVAEDESSVM